MRSESKPVVGQWYLRRDSDEMFRVVAVDAATGSIEIQTFDGDIEEVELDYWVHMKLSAVGEPEDWSGPFDDLEADDLGDSDAAMTRDWHSDEADGRWDSAEQPDELDEERERKLLEIATEEEDETIA